MDLDFCEAYRIPRHLYTPEKTRQQMARVDACRHEVFWWKVTATIALLQSCHLISIAVLIRTILSSPY